MIVKAEDEDTVSAKVEDYGILVIPKPMNRQIFCQSVKLVTASRQRVLGLKNENLRLQQKIDDIRLIDRAKCALIQYLNMTEPQAHRYIEKQAMDMRITKKEVAGNILQTYDSYLPKSE
jgi:response regulator NasT